MTWDTFFVASGVLFWLSVGAGGLWVGLCGLTDWRKRRRIPKQVSVFDIRDPHVLARVNAVMARRHQEAEALRSWEARDV